MTAIPRARRNRRRLARRPRSRLLFPLLGTTVTGPALDAALELARSESATFVPAYLVMVPEQLSPEAPILKECQVAMPLLEAVDERAGRVGVPVDARIERGRTPRDALEQLLQHERFDRIVVPAGTARSAGFAPDDIAWLLDRAPGKVIVLRPPSAASDRTADSTPTA
jgi:hypothetical protein